MKQSNAFVRVAAITSSLLLVCGFVLYRGGAMSWFAAPAVPDAHADRTAPASLMAYKAPDTPDVEQHDTTLKRQASSHESGSAARTNGSTTGHGTAEPLPHSTDTAETEERRRERIFMTSSKSMVPLIEAPPHSAASETSADSVAAQRPAARPRTFMGSSKSMAPLIEPTVHPSADTSHEASGQRDSSKPSKRVP